MDDLTTQRTETTSPGDPVVVAPEPRSASAVLTILGAFIAIPLLLALAFFGFRSMSGGGSDVAGIRDGRIQSVELTNGRVLFGTLDREATGEWLVLRDAFFLRRTGSEPEADAAAEAEDSQTELVTIAAEQGGDGDVVLNASEVVSFQNLTEDSEIGSRVEDAAAE